MHVHSTKILDQRRVVKYPNARRWDDDDDVDSTRVLLAENLQKLMEADPNLDSQPKLAKRAGVAQKTISNLLNADGPSPRLEIVHLVAKAFRMPVWRLLHPTLGMGIPSESELAFYKHLERLYSEVQSRHKPDE